MPGRRNLARELAHHDAPARFHATYTALLTHLPQLDRALIGRAAILAYLGTTLAMRRPNGGPLTWRMILRWHRDLSFPLVRGGWHPAHHCKAPPLTSSHAVAAWTCAQFDTAHRRATFGVAIPSGWVPVGKARREAGERRQGDLDRSDRQQTAA